MASELSLPGLVQLANGVISIKTYAICVTALWSYDYLLTLGNEVEYGWKTENKPMFTVFLVTRYLPVPFLVWVITSSWSPSYTEELCRRTAFLEVVYFILITLLAHTVLTVRIYAITGKHKGIAASLSGLTVMQLAVGVYLCVYASVHPRGLLPIDLGAYQLCLFQVPVYGSLLYTSFSLVFDLGAFVVVLVRMRTLKSRQSISSIPDILDTVTRDTAVYFLVIFTSHFVLVLTLTFTLESVLRLLPTVGNAIFVPMMVTRIILSLKKTASRRPVSEIIEIPNRFSPV